MGGSDSITCRSLPPMANKGSSFSRNYDQLVHLMMTEVSCEQDKEFMTPLTNINVGVLRVRDQVGRKIFCLLVSLPLH